jgi:hypothetical protein
MGLVADICNDFGFRSISFLSLVQIHNHFGQAIDVFYMTKRGNELAGIGRVEESQTTCLRTLYTRRRENCFSSHSGKVNILPFMQIPFMMPLIFRMTYSCFRMGNSFRDRTLLSNDQQLVKWQYRLPTTSPISMTYPSFPLGGRGCL